MKAGVYRHYKGGLYQVIGVGQQTETSEILVVYIALSGANLPGPRIRLRPVAMFNEIVKWPDGESKPRFVYVGDESDGTVHHL